MIIEERELDHIVKAGLKRMDEAVEGVIYKYTSIFRPESLAMLSINDVIVRDLDLGDVRLHRYFCLNGGEEIVRIDANDGEGGFICVNEANIKPSQYPQVMKAGIKKIKAMLTTGAKP